MIIAVDIGLRGAIAYSDGSGLTVINMPKNKKEINEFFIRNKQAKVVIELQAIRDSDLKTKSVYKLVDTMMRNYHDILFCCEINDIEAYTIPAKQWQSIHNLPKSYTDKKNKLRDIAKGMFPQYNVTLQNCDSILILWYVLKMNELSTAKTNEDYSIYDFVSVGTRVEYYKPKQKRKKNVSKKNDPNTLFDA